MAVTGSTATSFGLRVTGAQPGRPFWLVLGQSLSAGWKATSGGTDYGQPMLVDGYANGWRIIPTAADFDVHLAWAPQQLVWRALAVSGTALVSGAVLLVVTARRRRRTVRGPAAPPDLPMFEPLASRAARVPVAIAVVLAAAMALAALVLVNPVASIATGVGTLAAMVVPRGRLLLRIVPVGLLLVSVGYVVQVQVRHDLPVNGEWVQAFDKIATVSWIAVLLVAAEVVVTVAQRRYGKATAGACAQPPAPAVRIPAESGQDAGQAAPGQA